MASNRPRLSSVLKDMSRKDWEYLIEQYIKDEIDRKMTILYYLDGWCQEDIAATTDLSRKSVMTHLKKNLDIIMKHI
jgi:predicted DNA-binding protein YlxM (UPF0122 family)